MPAIPPEGKRFTSEYQPETKGRKKSILNHLEELTGDSFKLELGRGDKMRIIECMIEKSEVELKEIGDNVDMPIFTRLVAKRIHDDLQTGELSNLETILDRVYGRPAQNKIIEHKGRVTHVMGDLRTTLDFLGQFADVNRSGRVIEGSTNLPGHVHGGSLLPPPSRAE